MKTEYLKAVLALTFLIVLPNLFANKPDYGSIKGVVIDKTTNQSLPFATIIIDNSNIATISNSEGVFSLKFPDNVKDNSLFISFIGYEKFETKLSNLDKENNKIYLSPISINLSEVPVFPSDARQLMSSVLQRQKINYEPEDKTYRAFYRESIRKNRRYVSLTEAVINANTPGYSSFKNDKVSLIIGRKSTNYEKLDTLTFKLQGGPLSALMLDVLRSPYLIFDEKELNDYDFRISSIEREDEKLIYVIGFKPKQKDSNNLMSGYYFVDMATLAVLSVDFEMDVSDKNEAARLFIKKKPLMAKVYPTSATYKVNYKNINDVWTLSYVKANVNFKINWKRKLFNSNYYTTIEMVVTDKIINEPITSKTSDKLKMNVIMEEAVDGFLDDNFWGDYNIIEPDQPIEEAIKRIQKAIIK